jgi:hypothetical protein
MRSWDDWAVKGRDIKTHLQNDKQRVVSEQIEFFNTPKGIKALTLGRSFFSAISEEAEELVDEYVVSGIEHPEYGASRVLIENDDYVVLSSGLLSEYIGRYYTETVAAKEFLDPSLEIQSAVLVKYLSDKTRYVPPATSEYVVEHVYKGEMHVLYENTPDYMRLGMYRPLLAHGYQPNIDPPMDILIHEGTHVLVFTYEKKDKNNAT